jgi:hypothetical protein
MHCNKIIDTRCMFLYLFMGFLANLILLIEHEGELNRFSKVFKNFQNPIVNVFISLFYYFYQF